MATDIETSPQERPVRRKPFANLVKRLTNFKNSSEGNNLRKQKKAKNNPYPESGRLPAAAPQTSQPSFGVVSQQNPDSPSYASLPVGGPQENTGSERSGNKSGAPTLETNPDTVHSEGGHSKAATATTGGRALSSIDGAGAGSNFSSPNHSVRSLATTLTTIQSQGNAIGIANSQSTHHNQQSQANGTMFHQPFSGAASAIPRHLQGDPNAPSTYNSATANNLSSDNASILTLASSSKQRRRSMDTDASVRAMAPNSVWGGSRESLPLSVLSANIDTGRPPLGSMPSASAERASVYSSSGLGNIRDSTGINSLALASERNSYYAKQAADARSLRSINILKDDTRSTNRETDVASIRSLAPSEARLGGGHSRNDSIPGSIATSPLASPALLRQSSTAGNGSGPSLSRRGSDWRHKELDGESEGTYFEKRT